MACSREREGPRVESGVGSHARVGEGPFPSELQGSQGGVRVGIPCQGQRKALVGEVFRHGGEEAAPLQLGAEAVAVVLPQQPGAHVQPEAGIRIAPILPQAHLQRGGEDGMIPHGKVSTAIGQGWRHPSRA